MKTHGSISNACPASWRSCNSQLTSLTHQLQPSLPSLLRKENTFRVKNGFKRIEKTSIVRQYVWSRYSQVRSRCTSAKFPVQRQLTYCFSHPLHSAAIHFPIAFLSLSYCLDFTYGLATFPQTASHVRQVYNLTPYLGEIARISYYANTLGLLSATLAVFTGLMELWALMKRQDLLNKFQKSDNKVDTTKRIHPKIIWALVHASVNDMGLTAAVYNWWTRRSAALNLPTDTNILVSAVGMTFLFAAGYIGAGLVYGYGVGVANASENRLLKDGKAE